MRRLVVCCDGTWNTPDHIDAGVLAPTNVVDMARAVVPVAPDGTSQLVYYHPGVGTDNLVDKLTGGAFGIGLDRNVQDAYLFLVHNYSEGDEIYFFGFSRGAYTVRSTAGMLRKVGLLRKERADLTKRATEIYRSRTGGADSPEADDFRRVNSNLSPSHDRAVGFERQAVIDSCGDGDHAIQSGWQFWGDEVETGEIGTDEN